MTTISKKIIDIISCPEFKNELEYLNTNYVNLKQEIVIRNKILELFNRQNEELKSFAEVRDTNFITNEKSKRSRIDLVVKDLNNENSSHKTEIKFFFNKDIKSGRQSSINKNFLIKGCDLLIIIVQEFDIELRKQFLDKWNISDTLSKYHSIELSNKPFDKLINQLTNTKDGKYLKLEDITIEIPYPTTYKFYCLSRC